MSKLTIKILSTRNYYGTDVTFCYVVEDNTYRHSYTPRVSFVSETRAMYRAWHMLWTSDLMIRTLKETLNN